MSRSAPPGADDAGRPPTPLLDVPEVAGRLRVSPRFVWQLLARGRLTPVRFGRRCTRIEAAEVERFIEAARQKARG